MSAALEALIAHARGTAALAAVAERTGWDQETMMPAGAGDQRAEEMAALEAVIHARNADLRIAGWLADLPGDLGASELAQMREIARFHRRAVAVPADLAAALARATSLGQQLWAKAKAAEDVRAFLPKLAEIVALKRNEAAALSGGGPVYDALLDDHEPGMTAAQVADLFGRLRPRLVALSRAVADSGRQFAAVSGTFAPDVQLALARELALAFGYDLSRGRIDTAVHPFSSGAGADVRITTRTDPADPFNCLYSTIHEVGHASYEQNVADALALTPIGRGASMGVHESQSRLYENQLARSAAFCGWLFERMRESFGGFGIENARDFYGAVNRVAPGFIRTEADEVHYNLHVMMRFDLEKALISGDLQVGNLEAAWNDRMRSDFGLTVARPSEGVLQDVHWSVGLFGYFPTYTLGNVYAGCLFKALRGDLPTLDKSLAEGDPAPATCWLAERVHRHGALHLPAETIRQATGALPDEAPLLEYLEAKFGALYGLSP